MNLPIWALRIGAILLYVGKYETLRCYDSTGHKPDNIVECEDEHETCYSEFYMVRRAHNTTVQRINRFCVDAKHCTFRGFYESCLSLNGLDNAVQKTFRKMVNLNLKAKTMEIMHTRFCCCSQDLCNSMSPEEIFELFNVTSIAYSQPQMLYSNMDFLLLLLMSILCLVF